MLFEKSIEIVATPALTSPPQPPEKSGQALSKGEGPEPNLAKVFKRFNNFYPDNNDYKYKSICVQGCDNSLKICLKQVLWMPVNRHNAR